MSDTPIAITGFGLISPLGHSAWNTWSALLDGRTLSDRARQHDPAIAHDPVRLIQAVGSVAIARNKRVDPAVILLEHAITEAMSHAGYDPARTADPAQRLPLILGTSKGAMHAMTHAAEVYATCNPQDSSSQPDVLDVLGMLGAGPVGYLADAVSRRVSVLPWCSYVGACASALLAIHHACQLIRSGVMERVVVASVDAALLPMFIHSYRRLGVLCDLTTQGYAGRPLDAQRGGFMLSEIAGAVVLEKATPDRPCHGLIEATAAANDCFDMIRPSPDMAGLQTVMRRLMVPGRAIDLLHPHATGTAEHDPKEWQIHQALAKTMDVAIHDAYAFKGALGHGLGAAGMVATVLALLAGKTQRRPPMHWITEPIDPAIKAQREAHAPTITQQIIVAAGFGGHVAGLRLNTAQT